MTDAVKRIYVEKKAGFDVEARHLLADLQVNLGIKGLTGLRIVQRYDVAGMANEEYQQARETIFAEPMVDQVYDEELPIPAGTKRFAMEYLPGQYDQRADSAAQCVQILTQKERPALLSAKVILLTGDIDDDDLAKIKAYCINPVESREAALAKPATLEVAAEIPPDVPVLTGWTAYGEAELRAWMSEMGLAMSFADLQFCQAYFRDTEKRDPTLTEIKVIDTYWSDHCRHTTFLTRVEDVDILEGHFTRPIRTAYQEYLQAREQVYGQEGVNNRDVCLMDIAVIGMKALRKAGKLADLDESEEINACSIVVPVDVDGRQEDWLVMFKNETHNHPTEIEPFGGAATCLGGAIRDPLSGRSYVYQAMRVTGSGDPRRKVEETLPGKLPQRKITIGAAAGYSSYGNQIGLATGQVAEIYDEGYVAKRMEIGAVIAAAPRENVVREAPVAGDVVILVGGRTGRDGCGGATGSSKEHTADSLMTCGAEVQKGNPPTERKIQRLFRNPAVSRLIKRCNDFGAGGVSVAIGELTDALEIDLAAVPKKYEGLDGTELAISESQERMAVVVSAADVDAFCAQAAAENLETTVVAKVTDNGRLVMRWRDKAIVDLSREFLNTHGVKQSTQVRVTVPTVDQMVFHQLPSHVTAQLGDLRAAWLANLGDLNVCSQKGLVERFDSTIGAGTVLMPLGGSEQLTPAEGMVAKIPILHGETTTATAMSFGFNPQIARWSPFHGALYAVIEAVAKIVAMGGDYRKVRLTLQEYFEKLGQDAERWGKPFAALLGAFYAQARLGIPAIGGKDSMSGTFMDLHVPPTLVAFAVGTLSTQQVVSPEWKKAGSQIVLVPLARDAYDCPDFDELAKNYSRITSLIQNGHVLAAQSVRVGGLAAALTKACFGNRIGVKLSMVLSPEQLFAPEYGAIVLELPEGSDAAALLGDVEFVRLGVTIDEPEIIVNDQVIALDDALDAWTAPLEPIFATRLAGTAAAVPAEATANQASLVVPAPVAPVPTARRRAPALARPRVLIPVFPGTNCEYDSARAFTQAGADVSTLIFRNLTAHDVEESLAALVEEIRRAQIVMVPGGFSAGDEPEGSGKFIATVLRNPRVKEAVMELLKQRDGLMLGICNGFQALIKVGLVPFGEIVDMTPDYPTLTFNQIGRHISCMVRTKVVNNGSPWFHNVEVGAVHTVAMSHGEGRFVAPPEQLAKLVASGQIATQYVDAVGQPTMAIEWNPNGSMMAIEGITSPDGRVLGKMGHSERIGQSVAINVPGEKDQGIFAAGVAYFR
ncbi:phosphoribosylformylglycinamidine synthase [Heliophilum fasciatum]|uniref:Phosphoribosylformylglycinamidine synthase n=1 Tax=Heliophilum fasciatum TaxID=35700 RepID=A0A4R2RQ35_9FIRM|nr:phosphoribosylformylglycinamidine synthase [Heliophilum fasciatum]MCW2277511.1 phosphoribosylformylglycinamidine synthase [Heliophilum fasciatum]TCP65198.1 phosphoribosylformylglycinamidine synthase [Heliophilum fasciatum]